jgi:hypothetical protein
VRNTPVKMVRAMVIALPAKYFTTRIARRVREGWDGVGTLAVTGSFPFFSSIHYMK